MIYTLVPDLQREVGRPITKDNLDMIHLNFKNQAHGSPLELGDPH
jgi:hypothetical protein